MPILPKQPDVFPAGLLDESADASVDAGRAARAANRVSRWIPAPDERMLEGDLRTIGRGTERLIVAVRFLDQGASIELEDVDFERL